MKGKNLGITFSVPLEKKVLDELSILKEEAVEILSFIRINCDAVLDKLAK